MIYSSLRDDRIAMKRMTAARRAFTTSMLVKANQDERTYARNDNKCHHRTLLVEAAFRLSSAHLALFVFRRCFDPDVVGLFVSLGSWTTANVRFDESTGPDGGFRCVFPIYFNGERSAALPPRPGIVNRRPATFCLAQHGPQHESQTHRIARG